MPWRIHNGYAEVGAAWIKERNGAKYLSVSIENPGDLPVNADGKASLTLLRNRFKERDNQPDYKVSCKVDMPDTPKQPSKSTAPARPSAKPQHEPMRDEDIPF
jgi:uncharacterized protein (DUF736 family)